MRHSADSCTCSCALGDIHVRINSCLERLRVRKPSTPGRPGIEVGSKVLRTKKRILEEAKRLMLEKGYDATTISDITEATGIRRASFYTYFTSKEDVLMAMAIAQEGDIVAAEGLRRLNSDSSIDDVAEWVDECFAFWDKHGSFVYAAFQAAYAKPELRDGTSIPR